MATAKVVKSEKYIDLISQDSKEENAEQNGFLNEEARLQVQSSILETKKEIAKANRILNDVKKAKPYSLADEVQATQNVSDLEAGLAIAERIEKERF